jgi:hypothetical protein
VQTLLKVSQADWALAKRRERVLSTLAESKECSRAMVFRLLARYRKDRGLSALLLHPRGRKCGSGGLREEQEQIITAHIRKIGGNASVAALHRKIAAACRKR